MFAHQILVGRTKFGNIIDVQFNDWFIATDERVMDWIGCGTNDTIMAANKERPPFSLSMYE